MFGDVTIRVADRAASERFYRTVLGALGATEWPDLSVVQATAERPATRRLHIGFAAPSRAHVDAFWQAGVDTGHPDDGAPGPRPRYTPSYYGGFLRDPDGNSVEAVHKEGLRTDGLVDHLWFRVADLAAVRRFYAGLAPRAGLRLGTDTKERVSLVRDGEGGGSFSLVPGEPTEHVLMAFPARGGDGEGTTVEVVEDGRHQAAG